MSEAVAQALNLHAQMRKRLPAWAREGILAGYRGSHAHGLYVPPSDPDGIDDVDVFQVVVQPRRYYLGLQGWAGSREHYETDGETLDIVAYDVRKFVALLRKGNPNVHVWLWLRAQDYIVRDDAAEILIANRAGFLSQRVLHALGGYAVAQLRRMTHFAFEGYMGEKRKALVKRFGYDSKNAAHCIRLLHMGIELANEGEFSPFRTHDRDMLLSVKRGEWALDRVKHYAEEKFAEFEAARARCGLLPGDVAVDWATDLLIATMERFWEAKGGL